MKKKKDMYPQVHSQVNFEKITLSEYVQEKNGFDLHSFKRDFYTYTYNKRMVLVSNLNVYLGVGLVLFTILSGFIIYDQILYWANIDKNVEIKSVAMDIVTSDVQDVLSVVFENEEPADANTNIPALPAHIIEEEPTKEVDPAILRLRAELGNEEIVGYLSVPGTDIHYPVVQANDNIYYLNHDIDGDKNVAGSIFLDCDNNADFSDKNAIIYGHNMRDGSMFHNLRYFRDENFFLENEIIELTTVDGLSKWRIFSFFETGTDFNYIQTQFLDDDHALDLFSQMKDLSLFDNGVYPQWDDSVLTLSTCTNKYDDSRYVIAAVKI